MKNRIIVTSRAIAALIMAVGIFSITTAVSVIQPAAQAFIDPTSNFRSETKAPMAASEDGGNNVYVVWWTNRSGNWEVMFRASNDGGQTFGDKINLSNSTDTQSQTAEILAVGEDTVFVSWWELNENVHPHTNESVLRVSTDGGETFGPVIMLGMNGTISTTETANGNTTTAAEGEETVEEEAVGGTDVAE